MLREFPQTLGALNGALGLPLVESLSHRAILHEPSQIPGYEQVMQSLGRYMEPSKNPQWDLFPDILHSLLQGVDNSVGVVMCDNGKTADFALIPVGEDHYMLVPILSESEKPDQFWLLGKNPVEFTINTDNGQLIMEHERVDHDRGQRTSSQIVLLAPQDMILATEIKAPEVEVKRTTCLGYSRDTNHQKTTLELILAYTHPSGICGSITRFRMRGDTGEEQSQLQMGLGHLGSDASIHIPGDSLNKQIQVVVNDVPCISVGIDDGFEPLSLPAMDFIANLRTNPSEALPAMSRMLHKAVDSAKLT